MRKYEILAYTVKVFKPTTSAKQKIFAVIECGVKDLKGKILIYFLYPGAAIPENVFNQQIGYVQMYVAGEHYNYYLDLLRNEKPVFAMFDWMKPPFIAVGTGKEPVGEEESRFFKMMEEPVLS